MGTLRTITCDTCEQPKQVLIRSGGSFPRTCCECLAEKAAGEKRAALAATAKLSLEERLARIEEFMYDHERGVPQQQATTDLKRFSLHAL